MAKYYVIGDIHGSADVLTDNLYGTTLDAETYVILCGDVGILYGGNKMGRLLNRMSQYPCTFIVMRGNHDARYWKAYRERDEEYEIFDVWGNKMLRQREYPNVWYVRDEGGLYEIPEVGNVLFVPGAYSVDKWYRLQRGMAWEHDEQLTYREMDALIETSKERRIDAVISHTCPLSWRDQFKHLLMEGIDQGSVDCTMEKWLDILYDIVKDDCKQWFFGHYHDDLGITDDGEPYDPCRNRVIGVMLYDCYDVLGGYGGK